MGDIERKLPIGFISMSPADVLLNRSTFSSRKQSLVIISRQSWPKRL
jgi:hypothetical protein